MQAGGSCLWRAKRLGDVQDMTGKSAMGINKESNITANLQIGPTSEGMVRLYIEADGGIEIPMDFDPDEAQEIAEELIAAATQAAQMAGKGKKR